MTMMRIRKMDMGVVQQRVMMDMAVALMGRHGPGMVMRMVRIVAVDMFVRVFNHGVVMFMHMPFAQMQGDTDKHE